MDYCSLIAVLYVFMLPITHFVPNLCSEKNPGMSITRYKDPIPEGVCVFTTLDEAAKIQLADPTASLYPINNGHYIKILMGLSLPWRRTKYVRNSTTESPSWMRRLQRTSCQISVQSR